MNNKKKSPYSAALTGCGFMWEEMTNLLPILMSDNSEELLKKEIVENNHLMMYKEKTRARVMAEFKRRYNTLPRHFWEKYLDLSQEAKIVAMYYVNLKTYKILFDLHLNLVLKKWNSVQQSITSADVIMEMHQIAANDEFVESWSDHTKKKIASSFLSFLRKAGFILERTSNLIPIQLSDQEFSFYLELGETWYLEACLLQSFEINRIKESVI